MDRRRWRRRSTRQGGEKRHFVHSRPERVFSGIFCKVSIPQKKGDQRGRPNAELGGISISGLKKKCWRPTRKLGANGGLPESGNPLHKAIADVFRRAFNPAGSLTPGGFDKVGSGICKAQEFVGDIAGGVCNLIKSISDDCFIKSSRRMALLMWGLY